MLEGQPLNFLKLALIWLVFAGMKQRARLSRPRSPPSDPIDYKQAAIGNVFSSVSAGSKRLPGEVKMDGRLAPHTYQSAPSVCKNDKLRPSGVKPHCSSPQPCDVDLKKSRRSESVHDQAEELNVFRVEEVCFHNYH
jgi:hypothetical protein